MTKMAGTIKMNLAEENRKITPEAIKAAFGIKGTLSSDPKQNSGSLGVKVIF